MIFPIVLLVALAASDLQVTFILINPVYKTLMNFITKHGCIKKKSLSLNQNDHVWQEEVQKLREALIREAKEKQMVSLSNF